MTRVYILRSYGAGQDPFFHFSGFSHPCPDDRLMRDVDEILYHTLSNSNNVRQLRILPAEIEVLVKSNKLPLIKANAEVRRLSSFIHSHQFFFETYHEDWTLFFR